MCMLSKVGKFNAPFERKKKPGIETWLQTLICYTVTAPYLSAEGRRRCELNRVDRVPGLILHAGCGKSMALENVPCKENLVLSRSTMSPALLVVFFEQSKCVQRVRRWSYLFLCV